MDSSRPYVSIVLIIGTQRDDSGRALASVLSQHGLDETEVLIFDTALGRFPPLAESDHPVVKVHSVEGDVSLNILRAKSIEVARGEVVAFVEHHVILEPGWLDAIIRGFRAGHAGVGGVPGALNPGVGISDVIALINFGFFHPLSGPCICPILPANNSAYRRDTLLSFGNLLPILLASEVLLNFKITESGNTLLLNPNANFLHLNEETFSTAMLGYYYWNLNFGENRARMFHWAWWRRILQGLATPVIPFVRYCKYMLHFLRYDRQSALLLFRYTGAFLCTQGAAALGMAMGALFGAGDADLKFGDYELNYNRRA